MPDWMADEESADAKLGGSPKPSRDVLDDTGGRSRLVLVGGVGLLVVALIAAGAVYLTRGGGDEPAEPGNADKRAAAEQSEAAAKVRLPPDKPLARFAGTPSRMLGMVKDTYPGWRIRGSRRPGRCRRSRTSWARRDGPGSRSW